MKKNHLIVSLIQTFIIIASALLFPVTAHSQDLTEAQKQERCQNNKNRIAKLETQLSVINADLSTSMTKKEIEHERDNMAFIRKIKTANKIRIYSNGQDIPIYILTQDEEIQFNKTITEYNFSGCAEAKQGSQYSYYLEYCLEDLYKIIAKKIDKAELLIQKRPKLLQQKASLEKQIAFHRNKLIALGCDAINNTENTPDIAGTWKALKWRYEFKQNGKTFSWKITNDTAYGETADGEFLVGNRIKATWTNKKGKDSGEGTVIVENGRAMRINWDNGVTFTRQN